MSLRELEEEALLDNGQAARSVHRLFHHLELIVIWVWSVATSIDDESEAAWGTVCSLLKKDLVERICIASILENNTSIAVAIVSVSGELDVEYWSFLDCVGNVLEGDGGGEVEDEDDSHLLLEGLALSVSNDGWVGGSSNAWG